MNSFKQQVLASALVISAGLGVSFNAFASGTTNLTVNATITPTCKVLAAPGLLNFGAIDPSSSTNVSVNTSFTMQCTNGTTSTAATDNGGLNVAAGVKRMKHSVTATAFLPYAIVYSNDTGFAGAGFGAGASRTVTITGTVTPAQFQTALATTAGQLYADTVVITVNP